MNKRPPSPPLPLLLQEILLFLSYYRLPPLQEWGPLPTPRTGLRRRYATGVVRNFTKRRDPCKEFLFCEDLFHRSKPFPATFQNEMEEPLSRPETLSAEVFGHLSRLGLLGGVSQHDFLSLGWEKV